MVSSTGGTLASNIVQTATSENSLSTIPADNFLYYTLDGANFNPSSDVLYFPLDGSDVDFISYYPYLSPIPSNYLYPIDISDQSDPAAIDLLFARTVSRNRYSAPVGLAYQHTMCQLILKFVKGANFGFGDMSIQNLNIMGVSTTANFNLDIPFVSPSAFSNYGPIGSITPNYADNNNNDGFQSETAVAIILPHSSSTSEITITFDQAPHGRLTAIIPVGSSFSPGYSYTYTITCKP